MSFDINQTIKNLLGYGRLTGLISEDDEVYTRNLLLERLGLDSYEEVESVTSNDLETILSEILDYAYENKLIEDNGPVARDLFDTKIMNCLVGRPSEIRQKFRELYEESPKKATDWFYKFSQDTDYIRRYRIKKDMKWVTSTEYGDLDITINLSKPEKDPRAIAAAKNAPQTAYPKCQLCMENEGYAGRFNHPARENHRLIPITIANQQFYLQYSPYVYYNEHCIVFNKEHVPMKIDRAAFEKLFDFVKLFPHYTIGSNADLPIVGGSILSHDHFQGGNYEFPMARADYLRTFTIEGYEDVEAGVIKWPLSVIRLRGKDSTELINLSEKILKKWRSYTDEDAFIFAETDGEPHNTITPIVRMRDDKYEIDLTLRNNITTEECPLGLYHPHSELHHIKKENIGLIEVMGLAVLPSRLKGEMALLKDAILSKKDIRADETLAKHADWVDEFVKKYDDINEKNIDEILKKEIGLVFSRVLEDAGVYKQTEEGQEALKRFTDSI
ncbi:MAG: UDP-glucose--hexose-1-phosphate uridylyltransferase [Lachnospiraceae bacterium]|nr:UDP-glucose--hexose-1-phosphate uridylyltransferase [Lachnospiraceae bacterium]